MTFHENQSENMIEAKIKPQVPRWCLFVKGTSQSLLSGIIPLSFDSDHNICHHMTQNKGNQLNLLLLPQETCTGDSLLRWHVYTEAGSPQVPCFSSSSSFWRSFWWLHSVCLQIFQLGSIQLSGTVRHCTKKKQPFIKNTSMLHSVDYFFYTLGLKVKSWTLYKLLRLNRYFLSMWMTW